MIRLYIGMTYKLSLVGPIQSAKSSNQRICRNPLCIIEKSLFNQNKSYFSFGGSNTYTFDSEKYLIEFQKAKQQLSEPEGTQDKENSEITEISNQTAKSNEVDEEAELLGLSKYPVFFHYEILGLNPYDQDLDIKKQFQSISKFNKI